MVDVLPLGSIDVSFEVKELVELVLKQALKAKIDLHPEDESAMKQVIMILNQFENRFEPDPSSIKWVLNYLGIKSWSECHKEIKFLDEKIGYECFDGGNEREVPLLSSLVALMSYNRGTLFEIKDFEYTDQLEGRSNIEMITLLNPEDFRCQISLKLMTDPVTVSTVQTYDRASIQKWLKSGKHLCPKTGEKLTPIELVLNLSLGELNHQFLADNGVSLAKSRKTNRYISRTIVLSSPSAAESIKFLAQFLARKLSNSNEDEENKAAYEIRLLAKSNLFNRSSLIEALKNIAQLSMVK